MSRTFAWIATGGGAWSLASNWNDVTDGIDPSLTVPGPQDDVLITGPTGSAVQTITGQGNVAEAILAGNTVLSGSFTCGGLSMGAAGAGGLLEVGAAGLLSAGTLTVGSGSLIANGNFSAVTASQAVLGAGQSGAGAPACNLDATGGGRIQIANLMMNAGSAALYADAASSIEIGTLGGAALGALTIDAGATLTGQGDADGYAKLVNNGTIAAAGGTLLLGALTGTGLLSIGAGAVLTLNGATGAGQTVAFAGIAATLALATEFDQPQGTITGFAAGDAIDLLGSPISAATYAATGANLGVLTLYYGNQVADRLTLAGAYGSDVFLTAGDGEGGTLITVAPDSGGGGGPSGGTSTPDAYRWIAAGGGAWNNAANWQDLTAGLNPAHVAPGMHDLVSIDAPQSGGFAVITGPANAASLAVTGDLALSGAFTIGTLSVGQGGDAQGGGQVISTLDLLPATHLQAADALIADGEISVAGSSVLAVAGTLSLGGGPAGVGLPVTQLSATAGGTITAASLILGGGSGDSVTTDPTGVIEVGGAGGAVAGAVTVDAGATLTGNGSVNPFGAIVDNGTIAASGGVLTLGSVTGSGALTIGAGAALVLEASTAVPITFLSTTATAGATLALADELVPVTGILSGFAPGDTIDILEDSITGVAVSVNAGNTDLTLYYGTISVNRLVLAGTYHGDSFVLTPDGAQGTDLQVVQGSGSSGGTGQGTTDTLAWAKGGTGYWAHAANWADITTGKAALSPPGAQNTVELIGAQGSFQTVGGPGLCATLECFGDTLLSGAFTTGTLMVGGLLAGVTTAAILDVGASSGCTAATALVDGAVLVVENAASTLNVAGALTLGGAADGTLAVNGHGFAQLGGVVLAGLGAGSLSADAESSIEVGTQGGAAIGALTVDAGFAVSGFGAVDTGGVVIDNGSITAQGGTLAVGACSGTGALSIGVEATLQLAGNDSTQIGFTGNGATLLLAGSAEIPSGVISGFAQGDLIVTGASMIGSAVYTPGAGDIGTLTLYSGAAVAGTLLLAGDYAGDIFTVAPDGDGSAIGVQAASGGGPPAGTATPDDYAWTGRGQSGQAGTLWASAANWQNITAAQNPAAVPPGAQDLVTIQGATGSAFTTIIGPADAASLTLMGNVALSGQFSTGALTIAGAGVLALGGGSALLASGASIAGLLEVNSAGFSAAGTLLLNAGAVQATGQAAVVAGALVLAGTGNLLVTDSTGRIEIGTLNDAQAGAVTVDAGALLQGAGAVNPQGAILDDGTIAASLTPGASLTQGGTLALGTVAGSGTLLVGVGATLDLLAAAGAGLIIDFAGPGTLQAATALPVSAIAGFGAGDQILLPLAGVTDAEYAATAPGTGVLTLYGATGTPLGQLTLQGVGAGQTFTVQSTGSETIITTQPTTYGGGGSNMGTSTTSGGGAFGIVSGFSWWDSLPILVQDALSAFQQSYGNESYVYTSPDGTDFGLAQPAVANIAVVGADAAAFSKVIIPAGYNALLAQGDNPLILTDGATGDVLLAGNAGNDTIVGFSDGDTLVGGSGNSVIWSADTGSIGTVIQGGGSDTIVTSAAPTTVTTFAGGRSVLFLAPGSDSVTLNGSDLAVGGSGAGANETVIAAGADTVFAPGIGQLTEDNGTGRDLVVGGDSGTVRLIGGSGNGGVLWCGNASFAQYIGGSGSELIIGGSGQLSVQGGAGIVTVFAGSGETHIQGSEGRSEFVLGSGNATVSAASDNIVFLASAANDSLVANGGNVLIFAQAATGDNVFQAGTGPCTLTGGMGADTFLGGSGSATMSGSGADVYSFTNGLAGGAVVINGFNSATDQIQLHGYGTYNAAMVGGNEVLNLSDGTQIQLDGITSLAGVSISVG